MMKFMACVCALLCAFGLPTRQTPPKSKCDDTPDKVYLACGCPADTKPEPKRRCTDDPRGYTFSWISDTDQMPNSNSWCYYRGFKNLHSTYTVTVDFPEAGMLAVDVQPGGVSVDKVEEQPAYQDPVKEFHLYYAPLKDTQVLAGLYKPQQPKEAALNRQSGMIGAPPTAARASRFDTSKPIVVEIRRDLRDKGTGADYTILLSLTSRVEKVPEGYRYNMEVLNKSDSQFGIDWESVKYTDDPIFMDQLLGTFGRAQNPDRPGILIESGKSLEARSQTRRSPGVSLGVVKIYRENALVASAFAPAYVPNSDLLRR